MGGVATLRICDKMELKELIRQVLWQMYQSSLQNAAGLERVDAIIENAIRGGNVTLLHDNNCAETDSRGRLKNGNTDKNAGSY